MGCLSFSLDAKPPFRLDLTVWAFRRRPDHAVGRWHGKTYERVLAICRRPVLAQVRQSGSASAPRIDEIASGAYLSAAARERVAASLGLRADLKPFYRLVSGHRRFHKLVSRFRGLKPPRFPTIWESPVNKIACQQFSLALGIFLLNRLAALCELPLGQGPARAIPEPADLAAAAPEALRSLGFSGAKTRKLIGWAKQVACAQSDLEPLENVASGEAKAALMDLPVVGRWTADSVLLRGMGRTEVCPGDDIGARNHLARWLHISRPLDYARAMRAVNR